MKRIFLFCLCLVLTASCCSFTFPELERVDDTAVSEEAWIKDQKIYGNYTLDGNFDDSTVLVTLNQASTQSNRPYGIEDFADLDCLEVEDLTAEVSGAIKEALDIKSKLSTAPANQTAALERTLKQQEEKLQLVNLGSFRRTLLVRLKTPGKENVLKAIKKLQKYPEIICAEPNYYVEDCGVISSDPLANYQNIYTNMINLPEAWAITTGYNTVKVGIIDGRVDGSHPDLAGRVTYINCCNSTSTVPSDHATMIAGIIAAPGNNGVGIAGVDWNVEIVSLITHDSGKNSGPVDFIIRAIQAAGERGIKLLNCSFGLYEDVYTLHIAIRSYNILYVCSAGNNGKNTDNTLHYPSCYPEKNILSVSGCDLNNRPDEIFNYGAESVDLFAPGIKVYSTKSNGEYEYFYGTSIATPYVTGVAALMMSLPHNPTISEIKEAILNSTDRSDAYAGKCVTGGRLNAFRALCRIMERRPGTTVSGDFDGDGDEEIVSFYGSERLIRLICWDQKNYKYNMQSGKVVRAGDWFYISDIEGRIVAGDFDGDGIDEIAVLYDYTDHLGLIIYKWSPALQQFTFNKIGDTGYSARDAIKGRVAAGDFDGDGVDEVGALYDYDSKAGFMIYERLPNGQLNYYLVGKTGEFWPDCSEGRVAGGDFDGDGIDEMGVLYEYRENYVGFYFIKRLNNGSFFHYKVGNTGYFEWGKLKYTVAAGDFNGDGKDEMGALYGYEDWTDNCYTRFWIFERTSDGGFLHVNSQIIPIFNVPQIAGRITSGDYNNDGRDELGGIYHYLYTEKFLVFGKSGNNWYMDTID